ncbi:patatin-like phospholipase family protein, partial [Acinetobacter baumannii]|nr:patatin-like phospholipase family protein [Acinetobacter baumannii]
MNFKKLGIAFAGGGGKGAYQIGVWNALRELGLDSQIAAIAGTSVGALNGAMMAQGRYELAEHMWRKVEAHNLLAIESLAGLAQW